MSQLRHVVRQRDGITNHCHYIEFGRTVTVTFLDLRTMLYVCHPGVLHMSIDTIPMWIWLVPLLKDISSKSNELDPKTKGLWKSAIHTHIYIYIIIWWYLIPQQRKLGVFSHSKGSGAGRSSQNLPVPRFPGRAEQVGATKISGSQVPGKGFAGSQVPRWFPGRVLQGSQVPRWFPGRVLQVARFPGFKERFSSEGFQEKVPKSRFPRKGSQVKVPK